MVGGFLRTAGLAIGHGEVSMNDLVTLDDVTNEGRLSVLPSRTIPLANGLTNDGLVV